MGKGSFVTFVAPCSPGDLSDAGANSPSTGAIVRDPDNDPDSDKAYNRWQTADEVDTDGTPKFSPNRRASITSPQCNSTAKGGSKNGPTSNECIRHSTHSCCSNSTRRSMKDILEPYENGLTTEVQD